MIRGIALGLMVVSGACVGVLALPGFASSRTGSATTVAIVKAPRKVSPPIQSAAGTTVLFPSGVVPSRIQEIDYSPNGEKLAAMVPTHLWVWSIGANECTDLVPQADDSFHRSCFSHFLWASNDHVLVYESHAVIADVNAWEAQPRGTGLSPDMRWVLIQVSTGTRIRTVSCGSDCKNGPGFFVGTMNADEWYVRAPDGKLRIYDSISGITGSATYFDYQSGNGSAVQLRPGSDWFSTFVPDGRNSAGGLLRAFRLTDGETRTLNNVIVFREPALLVSAQQVLIASAPDSDENLWPVLYDLRTGTRIDLPADERWIPTAVSESRDVLLASMPTPSGDATYTEISLSYLLSH